MFAPGTHEVRQYTQAAVNGGLEQLGDLKRLSWLQSNIAKWLTATDAAMKMSCTKNSCSQYDAT